METNKAIEIYLPNFAKAISLHEELLEKQSQIANLLKGTPFEGDTITIFEHLVKVKEAMHLSGERTEKENNENSLRLDIVNNLLILFHPDEEPKLKGNGICTSIPKEIIIAAKNAAKELYDKDLSLCHQSVVKYKKKDVVINGFIQTKQFKKKQVVCKDKKSKVYSEKVIVEEYRPITDRAHLLEKRESLLAQKRKAGAKTNIMGTPHIIKDTTRMLCAIKIFCNCDGFKDWGYRGGKTKRDKLIFDCLQVFGYASIIDSKDIDKYEREKQRQNIKEKIRDAETSNIVFVSPPA